MITDSEVSDLDKYHKAITKLEECIYYIIQATQSLQESRCVVKNEIRAIFSLLTSSLHQREMQLYEQVDALADHQNALLQIAKIDGLKHHGSSVSSNLHERLERFCDEFWKSNLGLPSKLKLQGHDEPLLEAISSFGCVEVQEDHSSDESNFVVVGSSDKETLNSSLDPTVLDDDLSSVASLSSSSDSFEVLDKNKTSVPCLQALDNCKTYFHHVGSINVNSVMEVTDCCRPDTIADDCGALDKTTETHWLRKPDLSSRKHSPAVILGQDLAAMLSPRDGIQIEDACSKSESCPHVADSAISNLSSNLKCTVISDTHQSEFQNSTVSMETSRDVLKFSPVMSSILKSGNNSWLRSKTNPQVSCDTSCMWLAGNLFQKDPGTKIDPAAFSVDNMEESYSPANSINKMFGPYFQAQDKDKWLAKDLVWHKSCQNNCL